MMTASLSLLEREQILVWLVRDPQVSWTVLGERLGRHRTTISREVARNGGRGGYSPVAAQARAVGMSKRSRPFRLAVDAELAALVVSELEAGFSPAAVAVRARARGFRVCHETIYRAVYARVLPVDPTRCLRSRRRRRRRRGDRLTANPSGDYLGAFLSIRQRPERIETRLEVGHWEGDLLFGTRGATAIVSLIERVTYQTRLLWLPQGRNSRSVIATLNKWLSALPATQRRSLTWDQGAELTNWTDIVHWFNDGIYFCDRRSPWQRGRNEQNNRTLRFWFPHGTALTWPNDNYLRHVENILNNQPRRSLNWQTPNQAYHAHTEH